MIYWVTTKRHSYTIRRHLAAFGKSLVNHVVPVDYRALSRGTLSEGAYVFTDIERLSPRKREQATQIFDRLQSSGQVVLNRPSDVRLRYDLLCGLSNRGDNEFSVYRCEEAENCQQFPVYLRCENDHKGSRSPLLHSRLEMLEAIRQQSKTRFFFRDEHDKRRPLRIGSQRRRELLITEFCDTADERGLFRKYAAFCIAGSIVPRHLFFGTDWMLKGPQLLSPENMDEEREYVSTNPHEKQLREIFAYARIDYGRIDYSVREGRVQVWEINTNPMITTPSDELTTERLPVQHTFTANLEKSLRALDSSRRRQRQRRQSAAYVDDDDNVVGWGIGE